MNTLLQDLKFSFRLLGKTPGFTAAAITVLALGIGLNTAMFSVIHALAFSARAFPEPDRIVQLYTQDKKQPDNYRAFSYDTYRELRGRSDQFSGVLAHSLSLVGIGDGAESRRTLCAIVSSNYFDVLGVRLPQGRGFTVEEEKPGANLPVVVASDIYWRRTGAKADLVGSTIRVNERTYTVVGITPTGFTGTMTLAGPELYFPLGVFDLLTNDFQNDEARRTLDQPNSFNLLLVGRLNPGVSLAAAKSALTGIATSLEDRFPVEHKDKTLTLGPLPRLGTSTSPSEEGGVRVFGVVLMGLAAAVLLVVCLNLAGLLLARGQARRKEFAIRLALGGGRARIIRQLLTEGLMLSLTGGALGLALAVWSSDLLIASLGTLLPIAVFFPGANTTAAITATAVFAGLATLFFAFGPALKLSRSDVLTDLKQQAGEDAPEKRRAWLPRHPLVVAQIALSLALLIAAGLFIRMAFGVANVETGYHADNTIVAEVDASLAGYDENRTRNLYRGIDERLAALPGVSAASIGSIIPFGMIHVGRPVQRAGLRPAPGAKPASAAEGKSFNAGWNSVGTEYFNVMGVPLRRGRTFTAAEVQDKDAPSVAIIDDVLARKLWPDGDALGQRVEFTPRDRPAATSTPDAPKTFEIVGIVSAARTDFFDKEAAGAVYLPYAQGFMGNVHFHVRPATPGSVAAQAMLDTVRRELRAALPGVPIFKVRTFRQHIDGSVELWAVRMGAMLFSLFGGLAVVVAVVGIYGLKAYAVSRRTREIGIRMALGAEPGRVRTLILRESLVMTLTGLTLGLLLGVGVGQILASVFVDFSPFDPLAFGLAALGLLTAAMAACWVPATKATRVNPLTALRSE